MGKGSFWVIDGVKVKKTKPFVFQIRSHTQIDDKNQTLKDGMIINISQIDQFGRNFFAQNIQDIQSNKFDYGMLKNNSVSSLKDFHLFGPPPIFNYLGHHIQCNQNNDPSYQESKKSIFIDQFIPFYYNQKELQ